MLDYEVLARIARALEESNKLSNEQVELTRQLVELRVGEIERNSRPEKRWVITHRKLHVDGCESVGADYRPCACPMETTEKREL